MEFKSISDTFIFANNRLILVDIQTITCGKMGYALVAYNRIS